MFSFNKALAGALAAGGSTTGQLQPLGDYLAGGLSFAMSHTVFGAFSPAMIAFTSGAIVALLSALLAGLAVYLVPNSQSPGARP